MDNQPSTAMPGAFEARYLAFLETISQLRPRLHRYCSHMTGSVLDGEDVVQDALFEAYRNLDKYDDHRPLEPWLLQIAHNRCIDLLRRRGVREEAEVAAAQPDYVLPDEPPGSALGRAVENLVTSLPPMERACVLLKDVFDYTLEETAELAGSTVGGVKAALSRGRAKLASLRERPTPGPERNPEFSQLLRLYVERFNRHDWEGVRELASADARPLVADRFAGRLTDAPYLGNYGRWTVPWRMAVGEVDGEPVVIVLERDVDRWKPRAAVRLELREQRIVGIADYLHCPWILSTAGSVVVDDIS